MEANTLNCPMCGAAAATDASNCQHCGARLATISCPACFALMFRGAEYCSKCGIRAERSSRGDAPVLHCPECKIAMQPVRVGSAPVDECQKCDGLWADARVFEKICASREEQATVLGSAAYLPGGARGMTVGAIRYRPCPICRGLMHRVNFARCSGVVVDVCRGHGTWFDRHELQRIVEFISQGGLDLSRKREKEELEMQIRRLKSAEAASGPWGTPPGSVLEFDVRSSAVTFAMDAITDTLIW